MNRVSRVLSSMILGTMSVMLVAPMASAQSQPGQTKAGPIRLQIAGSVDRDKITEIKLGEKIEVVAKLRAGEFLDATAAFGNADVRNTTDQPMHYAYYVAFFDKEGQLVASQAQSSGRKSGLDPGKKTQLASCIMPLPSSDIERIASYQVRFIESAQPVGSK